MAKTQECLNCGLDYIVLDDRHGYCSSECKIADEEEMASSSLQEEYKTEDEIAHEAALKIIESGGGFSLKVKI